MQGQSAPAGDLGYFLTLGFRKDPPAAEVVRVLDHDQRALGQVLGFGPNRRQHVLWRKEPTSPDDRELYP